MVDYSKTEEYIFQKALQKWGADFQFECAIEEMAELIVAIKHFKRDRIGTEPVIEEVADVLIMMGELRMMLGKEEVDQMIIKKLTKLNNQINNIK